ncbi:MAG: Ada metal-binding domain-containing protein [Candidatus Paceibacterota bacterium]|jgi:hypothetical protein
MEKIKLFVNSQQGKDIMTVIIVILVGLGSFGLGRLSKNTPSEGLKIEYRDQRGNAVGALDTIEYKPQFKTNDTNVEGKNFFASSRGTKYYPLGCSAGKTIKQENRIYFNTAEEAEKAGYTLSTSC